MGNSEGAALEFCKEMENKYTPDFFAQQKLDVLDVETTCIQLDDFLEMNHANYTPVLVIFVSSYGVGQAPLGGYRFRELCDEFSEKGHEDALKGLKYAICGLGDSSYDTYLKNPKAIDSGLQKVGAEPIVNMGKANANAMGADAQDKVIAKWVKDLWIPLAKALASDDKDVDVKAMQQKTIPLLMKLDPDYMPPKELQTKKGRGMKLFGFLGMAGIFGILATGAAVILNK